MSNSKNKDKILGHARFEDGKLVSPSKEDDIKKIRNAEGKNLDYLFVLKGLQELPFGVGKKLLMDFLMGNRENKSIVNNRLYYLRNFGSMAYTKDELMALINNLIQNDMIEFKEVNANRHWKMMELSVKGKKEIENPCLYKRKLAFNFKDAETEITSEEKKLFKKFDDFLSIFNDEQKKAIISSNKHILCIAGAGSGKTTVLTKRIEFLIKQRSIDPKKILAITFTRKARTEMKNKLSTAGLKDTVMIETFNSFCEKLLRQFTFLIYDKPVRVVSFRDKIVMVKKALSKINMNIDQAINIYFTESQRSGKTEEQLVNIFRNDCFFIRDYFKFKHKAIEESSFEYGGAGNKKSVQLVISVCRYIDAYMKRYGLRDFADQLIDTLTLFDKYPEVIPRFDHVLIDEYQDVNSTQIHLIDLLSSKHLFCVGDPRQSIYGWRGSDIRYILNFEEKYPECDIIMLSTNYRSSESIVELINTSIKYMGLSDLKSALQVKKDIHLKKHVSEEDEFEYVIQKIIDSDTPRNEIFVLARTNKQLNKISQIMKVRGVKHVVRSDEVRRTVHAQKNSITLATIHAIKGMEAEMVFVIGCNSINFPCKGSEHPVIAMVKIEEYDKEEEERRIFYVAMSRAKKTLYLTHSGKKPTYFISSNMKKILENKEVKIKEKKKIEHKTEYRNDQSLDTITNLKQWRKEISKEFNIPAFIILQDRSLNDIAQKMPKNSSELEGIYGIGPSKISKYGEDILKIVNSLKNKE